MIFIIAGIIIGIILDDFSKIFGGVCGFFVGLVVYGILGSIIGGSLPTVENINTQNIVALNDSSKIEGQQYLFSGYINESLVYRYVVENYSTFYVPSGTVTNEYNVDLK